jgi:ubiquinone/menaquinone biosynthesis C-methylase UbiE
VRDIRSDQDAYYESTAAGYEDAHVHAGDEHYIALEYISGLCDTVRADTLLDVGAGTGRGVAFLRKRRPNMTVTGLEPVDGLRAEAAQLGIEGIVGGDGNSLPFGDESHDVVIATGVLHHVPDPSKVVAEMLRVARKAVVISDSNRFGQSSMPANLVKLALKATRTWPAYMALRTKGKGHLYSEGDGVFYSYSIFDSFDQMAAWSPRTFVIPTGTGSLPRPTTGGLLTSTHGVIASVREPCFPGWAGVEST